MEFAENETLREGDAHKLPVVWVRIIKYISMGK